MKRIKISIQLCLFIISFALKSQTYPFVNYSVQQGLSQSNVSGIVQDAKGFYWFATESGVSKFDGKNFITYTTENGLADNNISAVFIDKNQHIWFGHANGMLTLYNGKDFEIIKPEGVESDKKIYAISQTKKGSIWLSTASGAVCIINPEKDYHHKSNYKIYSGANGLSNYVLETREDEQENLWFLTDIGIKILDKKSDKFEFFRTEGMPFGQVTALYKTTDGNFLIGFSGAVFCKYDASLKKITYTISSQATSPGAFVYTFLEDKAGVVWASIAGIGVYRYNPQTATGLLFNSSNGLNVNKVTNIIQDREGNVLFGTIGDGVEVFRGEKFVSFSKKDGLISNQIFSICRDNNLNYWFGTNEGITIYNPSLPSSAAYKTLPLNTVSFSSNVKYLAKDKFGNMWIATWGGKLLKYNVAKSQFESIAEINDLLDKYVSALYIDSKNKLWIATANGLTTYDLQSARINSYRTVNGLSDNDITCISEDKEGKIWIGTKQKGITIFDGTFKKIGKEQGLTYNNITSVVHDALKKTWIGTEGGGVFVYESGNFTNYKTKNGLPSDFITLLSLDKNKNVWVGTNKGLCRFDENKKSFFTYLQNDGFTGIETKPRAVYNDDEGNIWFGTGAGVFKYNPKYDVPNLNEPLIHITRFRVNLKEQPVSDAVELSYKDNSLNFEFIGISLTNPDEVSYKVMLENYDSDWRPLTKNNFETYSNLPHGKYTLKIMAANSNGVWSKKPVTMFINIKPPFWKTWWFYVLLIVTSLTVIISYIKIRERKLVIEKKLLEEKVAERTEEVVRKNIELDEKNKDITASIRYAKRIQDAILPPDELVIKFLPKTFVLFKPKDIVSGDFYWLADKGDKVLFAAVDCTGHGVPGAFMSIVGHNLLDQIVGEYGLTQPAEILNALNKSVSDTLRQSDAEDNSIRDGMDIALCAFNRKTNEFEYAGAYNPLWLIRNGELIEYKANKFPIGNLKAGENKKFTNHVIPLQKGDTLYVFSDGYADQFGGVAGKKFKYSTFKKILLDSQHLTMEEQGDYINKVIEDWKGTLEQVDDILVIGTRL